ncbi:MAG: hypothetical protein RLY16_1796 [Bacteroidota bacterium]|jgi:hypothetical protein
MKTSLLTILLLICHVIATGQNCKVVVDSLVGNYTGDCKKGLAHGKGEAKGINHYIGDFVKGYPEGVGKCDWSNGNWYEGEWKEGKFNGHGTFHQHTINSDSAIELSGFWKNGIYVGIYEKPYFIQSETNNISGIAVRKVDEAFQQIAIQVKTTTGGALSNYSNIIPKAKLTNVQVFAGSYTQLINDEFSSVVQSNFILREVVYPFRAIFSFETPGKTVGVERVTIEVFDSGNWVVGFNIEN